MTRYGIRLLGLVALACLVTQLATPSAFAKSKKKKTEDANAFCAGMPPTPVRAKDRWVKIWYDGTDQDCDGASDYDRDGDGYDSASYGGDDCDDSNPDTWPGAPDEPYDGVINDCDSTSDYDQDGDGYTAEAYGGDDCDDANSDVNPGASEVWYDGVDQDCDGYDDDQDGDGWALADDCDDTDASSYPGAPGLDEDCNPVGEDSGLDTGDLPPADTGEPDIPGDTGQGLADDVIKGGGGCACGSAGGASGVSLALLALLGLTGLRRRRLGS